MYYFKLKSTSTLSVSNGPTVEFTELNEERWETRKIGLFPSGEYGYAHVDGSKVVELGGVGLSDKPWHSPSDHDRWLKLNPQFEETRIEKGEFEAAWEAAVCSRRIDMNMGPP